MLSIFILIIFTHPYFDSFLFFFFLEQWFLTKDLSVKLFHNTKCSSEFLFVSFLFHFYTNFSACLLTTCLLFVSFPLIYCHVFILVTVAFFFFWYTKSPAPD